jgi:hypothetical protein
MPTWHYKLIIQDILHLHINWVKSQFPLLLRYDYSSLSVKEVGLFCCSEASLLTAFKFIQKGKLRFIHCFYVIKDIGWCCFRNNFCEPIKRFNLSTSLGVSTPTEHLNIPPHHIFRNQMISEVRKMKYIINAVWCLKRTTFPISYETHWNQF